MKNKFNPAFNGLKLCFNDSSICLQILIASVVIIVGFLFDLSYEHWMMVLSAIFFVIVTEVLNTCIERLCDLIDVQYNEKIKVIKDLGAAAVLIASIYAMLIAVGIFLNL